MNSMPEQPFIFVSSDPNHSEALQAKPMPTPQRISLVRRTFLGPFGLRAGWSLLIYFTLLCSVIFSIHIIRHHIVASQQSAATAAHAAGTSAPAAKSLLNAPMLTRVLVEDMSVVIFFLASWLMATIERRKLSAF
jgi:hypothetical protein